MSCGGPHQTPCHDIIEQVYLYLDGEIGTVERERIRIHLDECSPCLRQFGIEQEVKALVARAGGGESAPGHLRQRLLVRLHEVRVEIDHREFQAE